MAGFLGSGSIFVSRKVDGVYKGFVDVGNATKFEIKENSEKKERKSKRRENYGSALNALYIKQPAEINMTLDDLNKENLALIFLGDTSVISVTGATVTDEAIIGYAGKFSQTAQRNISSVMLTDSAGATTYAEGVDYAIHNAKLGLIKILASGAITDEQALLIDYSYGNVSGNKVAGGVNSSIIMRIMFDGLNQVDQSEASVDVFEAVLSPTSGLDFLSDNFTTLDLSGIANVPDGGVAAYEVKTDVVYS